MPLFNYECLDCGCFMEKFQHDADGYEATCTECESSNCKKQMPFSHNRTWLDSKDLLREKVGPDAKRIMDNMRKGSDRDFSDIYGDN